MKILFSFFIYWCKAQIRIDIENSAVPRCYLCYQYTMMRGQDFIKREKNDDGCDRLINGTEIIQPRVQQHLDSHKAQTVCFYAHFTGTMRPVKQKLVFLNQNSFEFRILLSGLNQTMIFEKNVQKYHRGYLQLFDEVYSLSQNVSLEMETTLTSFGRIGRSTVRLRSTSN